MTASTDIFPALDQTAEGSSFRLPMWLLPGNRRRALFMFYGICRTLDDVVDDAPSAQAANDALNHWESELDAVFHNRPPATALGNRFQDLHRAYGFEPEDAYAMLHALRMDAEGRMVYPQAAELERYCYGVAGCVGLLTMKIFACDAPQARPFAVALGHALQCTNILRDVAEDARNGRVYLPKEAFGTTTPPKPEALAEAPELAAGACRLLGEKAGNYYREASELAQQLPARTIAPALAMGDVYACYWRQLRRREWHPPETSALGLSYTDKMKIVANTLRHLAGRKTRFQAG